MQLLVFRLNSRVKLWLVGIHWERQKKDNQLWGLWKKSQPQFGGEERFCSDNLFEPGKQPSKGALERKLSADLTAKFKNPCSAIKRKNPD